MKNVEYKWENPEHIVASRLESLAHIPRAKGEPDTFDINDLYNLFFVSMNKLRADQREALTRLEQK